MEVKMNGRSLLPWSIATSIRRGATAFAEAQRHCSFSRRVFGAAKTSTPLAAYDTFEVPELLQVALGRDGLNILVRVDGELLGILIEPATSGGGAVHATLAIALASELDPDNAIDVVVAGLGGRRLAEAGLDIAPFLASTGEGDATLVDDEAPGESLGLNGRGEGADVAALVEGAAVRAAVRAAGGERNVVGNIGSEAADPRAAAGLRNDVGKLGGGWGQGLVRGSL